MRIILLRGYMAERVNMLIKSGPECNLNRSYLMKDHVEKGPVQSRARRISPSHEKVQEGDEQ